MDAEVTHRVQTGWENWKRVSRGKRTNIVTTGTDVRGIDMSVEEGTVNEIGGLRNENTTMDLRRYDAGQNKK